MKYFLGIIFSIVLYSSSSANEDTCRIINLKEIYLGMNFEELSEHLDLYHLEYYLDKKNHSVAAEIFVKYSDINRLDFKFHVEEWENDSVVLIPNDAILTYLMVTYNWEVDIQAQLLLEHGAPTKETIPEIKQVYFFDKQWNCKSILGEDVQISLTHKRVEYELLKE